MNGPSLAALAVAALAVASCSSDGGQSETTRVDDATIESIREMDPDDLTLLDEREPTTIDSIPTTTSGASASSTTDATSAVVPEGFTTVVVEIAESDGTVCEICMWLADDADERGRGLMGVTSLGTPEGMAFVWDEPTSGGFFMFQTVTPLSIAWFGIDGALVSTADMDPCPAQNSAECERFRPSGEYVLAIEVFQGDLASIGITDGATARVVPGTESVDCPLA